MQIDDLEQRLKQLAGEVAGQAPTGRLEEVRGRRRRYAALRSTAVLLVAMLAVGLIRTGPGLLQPDDPPAAVRPAAQGLEQVLAGPWGRPLGPPAVIATVPVRVGRQYVRWALVARRVDVGTAAEQQGPATCLAFVRLPANAPERERRCLPDARPWEVAYVLVDSRVPGQRNYKVFDLAVGGMAPPGTTHVRVDLQCWPGRPRRAAIQRPGFPVAFFVWVSYSDAEGVEPGLPRPRFPGAILEMWPERFAALDASGRELAGERLRGAMTQAQCRAQ